MISSTKIVAEPLKTVEADKLTENDKPLRLSMRVAADKAPTRNPKIKFLKEFACHLLLIASVDVMVRLLCLGIAAMHLVLPVAELPDDVKSYLPISVTRSFVTIMDSVAIVVSAALGIVTTAKVLQEFWKDIQGHDH